MKPRYQFNDIDRIYIFMFNDIDRIILCRAMFNDIAEYIYERKISMFNDIYNI